MSDTWNLPDPTHESCPHTVMELFIPKDIETAIFDVYHYGVENDIEVAIYGQVVDGEMVEIYIPRQTNTSGGVGLEEDVPLKFNCIIHSHPHGIRSFSKPDRDTLLTNRDFCLLIHDSMYTDSSARLTTPCGCRMRGSINVTHERLDVSDIITVEQVAAYNYTVPKKDTSVNKKKVKVVGLKKNEDLDEGSFDLSAFSEASDIEDFLDLENVDQTDGEAVQKAIIRYYEQL